MWYKNMENKNCLDQEGRNLNPYPTYNWILKIIKNKKTIVWVFVQTCPFLHWLNLIFPDNSKNSLKYIYIYNLENKISIIILNEKIAWNIYKYNKM